MKILLIGGAGLIGSAVETIFSKEGHETLILDNFTSNSVEHADINGEVITGNACSFSNVNRAFAYFKPEVVYHFVDSLYDNEGTYDFQKESDVCINVANNISKCVGIHGVSRVFFGSSGEVYKNGSRKPINETAHVGSVSYTGATKSYVERMFELASMQYGFGFTSLRYFQVYGNRNFLNPRHDVLTFFIDYVLRQEGVVIVGPKIKIDILNITDAALATYLVFKSVVNGVDMKCVNIGSGEGVSLYDLYSLISSKIGGSSGEVYKTPPRRQTRSLVAGIKLLGSLGWKVSVKLEDELDSLIAFRENIINVRTR